MIWSLPSPPQTVINPSEIGFRFGSANLQLKSYLDLYQEYTHVLYMQSLSLSDPYAPSNKIAHNDPEASFRLKSSILSFIPEAWFHIIKPYWLQQQTAIEKRIPNLTIKIILWATKTQSHVGKVKENWLFLLATIRFKSYWDLYRQFWVHSVINWPKKGRRIVVLSRCSIKRLRE